MPFKKFQVTRDTCSIIPDVSKMLDFKNNSDEIIKFITQNNCKKLILNLRGLNLVDSISMAMLVSSAHYSKYYDDGSFRVVVDDEETMRHMKDKGYLNNADVVFEDLSSDLYCLA